MVDKMKINYAISAPTLIIKKDTGVIYTTQVDGCGCGYREIEGYICPWEITKNLETSLFFNPAWWYKQYGFSTDSMHELFRNKKTQSSYTLEELDVLLRKGSANGRYGEDLKNWCFWDEFCEFLDQEFEDVKLKVSQSEKQVEAWIIVNIAFGEGVITWENCD
jgi:hypothetical protein